MNENEFKRKAYWLNVLCSLFLMTWTMLIFDPKTAVIVTGVYFCTTYLTAIVYILKDRQNTIYKQQTKIYLQTLDLESQIESLDKRIFNKRRR